MALFRSCMTPVVALLSRLPLFLVLFVIFCLIWDLLSRTIWQFPRLRGNGS